ncbi:MAG: 2-amino-4-hydroxy-6-hydroxymethyldihydropteridine diphosphokinase [Ignavibacteriales bacterium]|nr:2-amino-4-hydroxy-6-hydroxymethyldihydropteridine diphosphokinase [Ignavibacteriales bacterium]
MSRVFLGLGSNIENRLEYLQKTFQEISKQYNIISVSAIYETEPIGETNQQNFLNAVIEIETDETPKQLFSFIKSVEKKIGRIERGKWQAREIDIDILLFDNVVLDIPELTIPHKEMHNRKFVLQPASEIAGSIVHPVFKKSITRLSQECQDNSIVQLTQYSFQSSSS